MRHLAVFFLLTASLFAASIGAQDFGFGFDDEESSGNANAGKKFSISVGGEVSASVIGYFKDYSRADLLDSLGDIFSGKLNLTAKTSIVEGIINLKMQTKYSSQAQDFPVNIDEAYLRAFFGKFDIEAGYRKLTWGKADSMGPLDVINPLDTSIIYTEMADNTSLMGVKLARPMLHATYRFGQFSKIEGVFIPTFKGHYIDTKGRWVPAQIKQFDNLPPAVIMPPIPTPIPLDVDDLEEPKTDKIDYAQGGLRFTTTIGNADIGAQYYYGCLPQPSVKIITSVDYAPSPPNMPSQINVYPSYLYNSYHQIGIDYAQVLFDFNVRAELAVNITEDLEGDDGSIYNPTIAWSFGFDRDLFAGINLNLQVNESIILKHSKLGSADFSSVMTGSKFDIEGGKKLTSTRITAALSKKFLRDELELRTAAVYGVEDKDCLIIPALIWTKDDLRTALSAGIFAGDEEGQLGQYKDNNFIKFSITYSF